nr:unnamed protein product [Digitaria exilis]
MFLVKPRCLLHLLWLLAAMVTTHTITETSLAGHDGDERALVDFKAKISGHSGALDSWNQSTSYCSWEGITCGKKHWWRVVALNLNSQGLTGTISPAIGNLTFLCLLNLSLNTLQGEIPPSIGSLRRLQRIDLSTNILTGIIPSNISRCISLRVMYIHSNKGLQGRIPVEIGAMPSLLHIVLYNNSITGTIPSSLGNLSRLVELSLKGNYFEGSIPSSIGNNPYLIFLQLSVNNLSGLLPPSLYNLSSVSYFYVANNELHGQLPFDLGKKFPSIQEIAIGGNRFNGALPQSITNMSRLQKLYMENNGFTGIVPSKLGRLKNLEVIALDGNMLEANNEEEWEYVDSLTNCSRLQMLSIGWNRFAGKLPRHIPSSIGNLTESIVIGAYANNLEGPIPSSIGNLSKLLVLDISINKLTGFIPKGIMELPSTSSFLDLSYNLLEGPLPAEVARVLDQPMNSNSSLGVRGSIGYIAPEYGDGLEVSTCGDVFSLGITLIEMFTGRSPTNDMFKDGLNLHHYAEVAFPDKIMEIADANIWLHEGANTSNDTRHRTITKECLSSVIELGILCSKQLPVERLSMSDAATEMHAIRDKYISAQQLCDVRLY